MWNLANAIVLILNKLFISCIQYCCKRILYLANYRDLVSKGISCCHLWGNCFTGIVNFLQILLSYRGRCYSIFWNHFYRLWSCFIALICTSVRLKTIFQSFAPHIALFYFLRDSQKCFLSCSGRKNPNHRTRKRSHWYTDNPQVFFSL